MLRPSRTREHAAHALSTVQTVLSLHVRAGHTAKPGFVDGDAYAAMCREPLCDLALSLPAAV